jgi:hypothetical protein
MLSPPGGGLAVTRWEAQQGSVVDLVARIVEERAEEEREREQLADDVIRAATTSTRRPRPTGRLFPNAPEPRGDS